MASNIMSWSKSVILISDHWTIKHKRIIGHKNVGVKGELLLGATHLWKTNFREIFVTHQQQSIQVYFIGLWGKEITFW